MTEISLKVTKPIGFWNRTVNVDFKELFIALTKSAISFYSLKPFDFAKSIIDGIKAFKLDEDISGNAYRLILISLINSAHEIVEENKSSITTLPNDDIYHKQAFMNFLHHLQEKLDRTELTIDHRFFLSPTKIDGFNDFKAMYYDWLILIGFNKTKASFLKEKLDSYFVYNLNNEWRKNFEKYSSLYSQLNTPFTTASKKEIEWQTYTAFLSKQINESVFDEAFGLSQIYVPLRAYYEIRKENKDQKIVITLDSYIRTWLREKRSSDSVKVISGGPGSGKSTAVKMLASEIALEGETYVIFIPLQHFNVTDDLSSAIDEYLNTQGILSFNPLKDTQSLNKKLLIIFDGLDELSKQGKFANEVANQFIIEVLRYVHLKNHDKANLQIIITGREVSIQSQSHLFRQQGSIVQLLPYFIDPATRPLFQDGHRLLSHDQRKIWWKKYTTATNKSPKKYPSQLLSKKVEEITSQPLLCYLIALSFFRKKIDFSENVNLNEIYEDLIKSVFSRKYEASVHSAIKELNFSEENFFRILEEIAISAWHSGDIRSTTVGEINKHISENNLSSLFQDFQKSAESGITRLLTAFYFRQKSIDVNQNKTFEFTHKSFGEYLVGRRLVNLLHLISKKITEHKADPDSGFDYGEALKRWIVLAGQNNIDNYIFGFIKNEIALKPTDLVEKWQADLISLFNHVLRKGLPMEKLTPRAITFKDELRIARNAEEALLVCLYCSAIRTDILSEIDWPDIHSFSSLLGRIKHGSSIIRGKNETLCNACLGKQIITNQDLGAADLTYANFANCQLTNVIFAGADIFRGIFENSKITDCNFYRTNFQYADFTNCNFKYSENNKPKAYLTYQQFSEAFTLRGITGLPDDVMEQLQKKYPKLMSNRLPSYLEEEKYVTHRTEIFKKLSTEK